MARRLPLGLFAAALCAAAAALAAAAVTVFLIDPFQYFRRSENPQFSELMQRYQAPGVIRNYSFDKIILGSSTVANLSPSLFRANGIDGVQNLSFWGGTLTEAYRVLRLGLSEGKIKTVYWAVDPTLILSDFRYADFPSCMYDRVLKLFPYCYLFNSGVLTEALASALDHPAASRAGFVQNLDRWKQVSGNPFDAPAFGCEIARRITRSRPFDPSQLDQIKRKFSTLVIDTARLHPDVHFNIIFPPLFAPELWLRAQDSPEHLPFIDWAEQRIVSLPNASVFDFQLATGVTNDETSYRDTLHAEPIVAALMVQWLTAGTYRLQPQDLAEAAKIRLRQRDDQANVAARYPARECASRP